jgi:hypothetical protein
MSEIPLPTTQTLAAITAGPPVDLRSAGFTPREIHRLHSLRDCLRCYPHLEYFTNRQWRQLLFMKWRYDRGEYADDMPPGPKVEVLESDELAR